MNPTQRAHDIQKDPSSLPEILDRSRSYIAELTPDEARTQLQGEMNRIWELLSSIQEMHNSLSLLLKLPDELLVEVAWDLYYMLTPSWKCHCPSGLNLLTGFLPLTKTCHRLRHLFLSTPGFWTLIDLQTPLAGTCIQRSGTLPLYIVCDSADGTIPYLPSDLIREVTSRAKALQFDTDYADTMRALLTAIEAYPLPDLQQLSLKIARLPHPQRPESLPYFVPKLGSGEHRARLDTVLLRGVVCPYPSPLYVGLQRLELTSLAGTLIPSEEDFFALLQHCPDLAHLSIQGTGPEFAEKGSPSRPILLQHLITLNLTHHLRNVHCILASIDCPSLRLLTLSVLHSTMRDTFTGIFPPRAQLLERIRHKCAKKVEVGGGFTSVNSLDYDSPIVEAGTFKFSIGLSTPRRLFGNIAEVFGSAECHELIVTANGSPYTATADKREWNTFFNGFPNLNKLGLHHLPDFLEPFAALKPVRQRPMHLPTLLCPVLRDLEVSGFNLDEEGYQWMEDLRSTVDLRWQHRSPIDTLKLTPIFREDNGHEEEAREETRRFEACMDQLKGLVTNFSWEFVVA